MVVQNNTFCEKCKKYNCSKHSERSPLYARLLRMVEYFENPEEDEKMRTYITPEKHPSDRAPVNNLLPVKYQGEEKNDNFDRHDSRLRIATDTTVPMPRSNDITTTQIINVNKNNEMVSFSGGKYKPHRKHHFVDINNTSFVSCTSPDGNYSEIAFVLWLARYEHAKYPSDRYRVIISLMYDAEDDIWSLSAKLVRRTLGYYSKDEEEGQIPNRLCLASELRFEIKKMLLFLGISPREAYRMFRKNAEGSLVISKSEFGFSTVESALHSTLLKELEKPTTSSTEWNPHRSHRGHHNYPHFSGPHGASNPDAYKEALLGYDCGYGE